MEENYRKMWLMEIKHGHEQCSRIIELEQLCRDMWWDFEGWDCKDVPELQFYRERMEQLGLLEGNND